MQKYKQNTQGLQLIRTSGQSNLTKRPHHCHTWMVALYFAMCHPFPALKIAISYGVSGPPSNMWFLGPIRVHKQMVSRLVKLFLQNSQL